MKVFEVLATGKFALKELSRSDLAGEFGIHFRDFRPVFSASQVATILPRKNCIIVNLGLVKTVIASDKMYVFNTESSVIAEDFVVWIAELFGARNKETRFELLALEKALAFKIKYLGQEEVALGKKIASLLQKLKQRVEDKELEKLLKLKKQLSNFMTRARENESAILEILEDNEALGELYLKGRAPKNLDEPESILESALEQFEDMIHNISEHKEHVDGTQEVVNLKLSARRNKIIRFDLFTTLVTGMLAFLTLITGIFGMNIRNQLEQSFNAFEVIILAMGGSFFVFLLLVWWYLKREKML